MMTDQARILIFTGNGKGKTTAALGMAFRASGHGLQVLVIQFVKEADTGEIIAANAMANMEIIQTGQGFLPKADSMEYCKHKLAAEEGLALADESIQSGNYDLIILDEICVAVSNGLLSEKEVAQVISKAPPEISLVLTGRNASQGLIDLADTVSNIGCVKHAYHRGIAAQKGVEF
ncbi:MAG: cob(I)yrinic acid a,c-diamide adenosyltransferase [Planctomycetes bacterium]|nr:cob(I)yrinic acid a,c-diamide adenosyltransferase [Planctomycetota bacterium]